MKGITSGIWTPTLTRLEIRAKDTRDHSQSQEIRLSLQINNVKSSKGRRKSAVVVFCDNLLNEYNIKIYDTIITV